MEPFLFLQQSPVVSEMKFLYKVHLVRQFWSLHMLGSEDINPAAHQCVKKAFQLKFAGKMFYYLLYKNVLL